MKIQVPYHYEIKALNGRNRVNTDSYDKYAVLEFDVTEVEIQPFMRGTLSDWRGTSSSDFYLVDGHIFRSVSEEKPRGNAALGEKSMMEQIASVCYPSKNALSADGNLRNSNIIPDGARITEDTQDEVVAHIKGIFENSIIVDGKLVRRTNHAFRMNEDGNLAFYGTAPAALSPLIAYDEVKFFDSNDVFPGTSYECFSDIGDLGKYDAHNSDIALFLLMSVMKPHLSLLSQDLVKNYLDIRDELISDCTVEKYKNPGWLDVCFKANDNGSFVIFKERYMPKSGAYSLNFIFETYREANHQCEYVYNKKLADLMRLHKNIQENKLGVRSAHAM